MKKVEFLPRFQFPDVTIECYFVEVDGATFGALYPPDEDPDVFTFWIAGVALSFPYCETLEQVKAEIVRLANADL